MVSSRAAMSASRALIRSAADWALRFGDLARTGEGGFSDYCRRVRDEYLPKRLTEELQDPNNPKTKVPLEKMKKVFYRARGWKDGIPTWHRLKTLGIKIDKSVYDAAVAAASRID